MPHAIPTPCSECGQPVAVPSDATPGELLLCDHCGVELEVADVDPPRLTIFEEEEK